MTRLLSRERRYRGKHRAPSRWRRTEATTAARVDLAPHEPRGTRRPGALRTARARWRRRAPYAAAGLLALTGAVSSGTGPRAAAPVPLAVAESVAPEPRTFRPAAVRPAPVRVYPRATTRPASRSRTVEVAGPTYRGRATWYGPGFAGRRTASGEVFHPYTELTAAHRWLPFGTRLRVCRRDRCVVVRVNDRGPFGDAMLDLSRLAAERLGMVRAGIAPVTATVLSTRVVRSAA
ncbi:MAG TPA: septal ring lytic transglycosylase RlpA family protein [Mycobacteriales bacterium]|jgi:rare lipoprotein A